MFTHFSFPLLGLEVAEWGKLGQIKFWLIKKIFTMVVFSTTLNGCIFPHYAEGQKK